MTADLLPTVALICLSVLTSVAGQTTIKLGVSRPEGASLSPADPVALIAMILHSPLVMAGLILYGVGALSWIIVLSRLDLSLAYPFVALNFVLIAIVSRLVLSESIPSLRWVGIAVICIGILLVARSANAG